MSRTLLSGQQILDGGIKTIDIADLQVTSAKMSQTGITPGTYDSVTVDAAGRVTAGTTGQVSIISSLGYTPLNKAGDSILGPLSFPKASGSGIQIENTFGWRDLLGDVSGKSSGSTAPTQTSFFNNTRAWAYSAGDQGDLTFHLPHDYAPGTDLFLHFHWSHNGNNISGNLGITCNVTYAKGHQQAIFSSPISPVLSVAGLNITNTPKYFHRVDEMQLSTAGGSASMLDTSLIEVDGIIMVSFTVSTIPSISGSISANVPFILSADLHYQSTGIPTKNKAPNFYA